MSIGEEERGATSRSGLNRASMELPPRSVPVYFSEALKGLSACCDSGDVGSVKMS